MNQYQFLKQLTGIPTPGGDGIRVTRALAPFDLSTAAGLGLTAATIPAIVAAETNALVAQCVAGQTALGSFVFEVPKDYDTVADELKINLLVNSGGNTDSPTVTVTAYRKRAGIALTAALTVVASTAIPKSATPATAAAERTITLSGNLLQAGDVLTVNLVTAAHATDAVNLYHTEIQYKSSIVFSTVANRTA